MGEQNIEELGLDSDAILSREDEIRQYLLDKMGEPYLGYKTRTIIGFIPTAIKAVKIYEMIEDEYEEAKRISKLTLEEWQEYRGGVKWSQSGRAEDVKRKAEGIAETLFEALHDEYSGIKIEGKALIDVMKNAPIVKDILSDYSIRDVGVNSNNFLDNFELIKN